MSRCRRSPSQIHRCAANGCGPSRNVRWTKKRKITSMGTTTKTTTPTSLLSAGPGPTLRDGNTPTSWRGAAASLEQPSGHLWTTRTTTKNTTARRPRNRAPPKAPPPPSPRPRPSPNPRSPPYTKTPRHRRRRRRSLPLSLHRCST